MGYLLITLAFFLFVTAVIFIIETAKEPEDESLADHHKEYIEKLKTQFRNDSNNNRKA